MTYFANAILVAFLCGFIFVNIFIEGHAKIYLRAYPSEVLLGFFLQIDQKINQSTEIKVYHSLYLMFRVDVIFRKEVVT